MLTVAGNADFNVINANQCGHTKIDLFETKYIWAIDNFSYHQESPGAVIESPVFTLVLPNQKLDLILQLYPKSMKSSTEEYVSLFFKVISQDISIKGKLKIGIVNRHGQEIESIKPRFQVWKTGDNWGNPKLVLRSDLSNPKSDLFLTSDRLIVYCKFSAVSEVSIHYANLKMDAIASNVSVAHHDDYIKELFESKRFSDFALVANGENFKAHKSILAAKSPVFSALLSETNTKHEINDFSHQAVTEMLRYIYTGEVENIDSISQELLLASIKYEIQSLRAICQENIISNMDVGNVLDVLMFARTNQIRELKSAASLFLQVHAKSIMENTDGFEKLDKAHLKLALSVLVEAS